jgi:flavin-dependent dehydrogenase
MVQTDTSVPTDGYDALVVGGRVAGASTALLLARAGYRVAVLDRVRFPSDTLSTHLIWPAGVILLQRWGLLGEIVASEAPALSTIRNDIDGNSLEIPLWPDSGVDVVYAPRRTVLDPIIMAAAERAGAEVYEGITIDGVSRDRNGRVGGVVGHDDRGHPLHVGARVVVGADGWRSRIARDVRAPIHDERARTNAVHYAYWSGLEDVGMELWYRTAGLMAGVFPTNGGACVWVNCRTGRVGEIREDVDRNYLRFIEEAAPDLRTRLACAARTSPVRGTPGLPGVVRQPHGPGWVLVGDAGCIADPAGGHGITAALRDAELAARAIVTGLRDPSAADEAMRSFHVTRDRSLALYDLSWAMASYDWTAAGLFDIELRFGTELVREARETAALPAWTGVPEVRATAVG